MIQGYYTLWKSDGTAKGTQDSLTVKKLFRT
jgi:hypothetical protein